MAEIFTFYALLFLILLPPALGSVPSRVITTSPSLTELVYQVKGQDKLVATVDYSYYPEAAKLLPTIGSFFSPSIEKTLMYKPDLVLIDGAARNFHYEQALERLGIAYEVFNIKSLLTLEEVSLRVQKILGTFVEKKIPTRTVVQKNYSFLGFVWTNPSIILSKNTFLNSLIASTGGKNLCEFQSDQSYITVSKEWLMLHSPDTVFLLYESDFEKQDFIAFTKNAWPEKIPKVVFLPSREFARTTFTAVEGIKKLVEGIYGAK